MAEENLLQSWKEIAAHLGRSERTCRRWETEFKLPVHRMDGSVRGSVFAYKTELDRWMDEILHEEKPEPPSGKRPSARRSATIILALAGVAAAAIAIVVLRVGESEPPGSPPSSHPTLAILPFTNNTGDETLDFWENALADLLVSDLSQSRYLTVLSQDRVLLVLEDLGQLDAGEDKAIDLAKVAARAKVDSVVAGSFIKAGQRFRISATVRRGSTGETVVLPSVEARSEDEIFFRVDELSTRIRNHLVSFDEASQGDVDLDVGSITTCSLEAYRHYIDGRSSWRDGRSTDAMSSFERAVAIDPEFAMAHSWLAECYSTLAGYEDEAEESRARAFEFSDNASPRERLYIQGQYFLYQGQRSYGRALENFTELVQNYHGDEQAVARLGSLYRRTEQWEKCIETFDSMVEKRDAPSRIYHLRLAHCALGEYEAALEVAKGPSSDLDSLQYRHQLAMNLVYQRRFDEALLEADRMLELSPGSVEALQLKGDIHFLRNEWDEAEEYYRQLLTPVTSESNRLRLRFDGLRRLARLYHTKGQPGRALEFIDQAIEEISVSDERPWLLVFHIKKAFLHGMQGEYPESEASVEIVLAEAARRNQVTGMLAGLSMRCFMNLDMGDVEGAKRAAAQMKEEIEGWFNPKLIRRWHFAEGHIQLAEENFDDAVAHFERAVSLLPHQYSPYGDAHAWYYDALAHAYYLMGDLEKAQAWYEDVQALTGGRLVSGIPYAESFFMLGQIYERRGEDAEAIRMYRTYLDLLRDAESPPPEIEEAKHSLAALRD
jgi:tetratricopeptide (TPR) repeat protein